MGPLAKAVLWGVCVISLQVPRTKTPGISRRRFRFVRPARWLRCGYIGFFGYPDRLDGTQKCLDFQSLGQLAGCQCGLFGCCNADCHGAGSALKEMHSLLRMWAMYWPSKGAVPCRQIWRSPFAWMCN